MNPTYKLNTDMQTKYRMRQVRTSNTSIEQRVSSALRRLGIRFKTKGNVEILGKPDFIVPQKKTAIFVNGCFWHGHSECKKGITRPKRNADYWESKINNNKARDTRIQDQLVTEGWSVLIIWECETDNQEYIENTLSKHLNDTGVGNEEQL